MAIGRSDRVTILITGAGGFIGRHLTAELVKQGSRVVAVDKNPTSLPGTTSVAVDMSERGWTERLSARADVVVHLAQSLRYREFPAGSEDMVRVNVDATHELLEWSRRQEVRRFLFASTGNVYVPRGRTALQEEDVCVPASFYAATKLSAEHIVKSYGALLQPIILRLFGVYGPGQKNMLIPNIIEKVRTGAEITLAGGEGLLLTPLFIEDCVAYLQKLANPVTELHHDTYNLAGVEILTLNQIAEAIGSLLGKQPRCIETHEAPSYLIGSPDRVIRETEIAPMVRFSEGIKRMLTD